MDTLTLELTNPDDIRSCQMEHDQLFRVEIDDDFATELRYAAESGLVEKYIISCDSYLGEDCKGRLNEIDDLTVASVLMWHNDTQAQKITIFEDEITYQYGELYPAMTQTQESAIIGTYAAMAVFFVLIIVVYMVIDLFKRRSPEESPSESEQLLNE